MAMMDPAQGKPARSLPLVACSRGEPLPLSFAQQRLWFIEQLEPGGAVYNVSFFFQLRGSLAVEALRLALQDIVARHEVLRTRFCEQLGQAHQVVDAPAELAMPVQRLDGLADAAQQAALAALAQREAQQPFDLARGPLIRVRLVRLAEDRHALVVVTHHIVCDNWSMGIVIRELGALYRARLAGAAAPLPPLAIQYADFAVWQRRWLAGAELERLLGYWQRQLAGIPTVLDLPADRPRPAQRSGRGARMYPELPRALTAPLMAFSRQESATLYMTLLAAFAALLARYSRQDDIVVGTPIAGRNRRELEGMIGFFANTLVLRIGVDRAMSFRALVKRVRAVCLDAYAHQDVPFEKLVDAVKPERDLSRTPLFQVMFGQGVPPPRVELGESTLEPLLLDAGTASFDLTVSLHERDGAIAGWVEYSADLFDAPTIERLVGHYGALLAAAIARPDDPVGALPLLSEAELRRIVVDWNQTAVPVRPLTVVELVAEQVRRVPEAPAVIAGDVRLSYRELDERAEHWAAALRARGCGPGARVALALSRGPAFPVMVLAVLKAGAAYVPLDPTYPAERLAFMLADCGARVLVSEAALAVAAPPGVEVLRADEPPVGAATGAPAGFDDLAYVIYTSGSTGRPKGVAMPHGAVANLIAWQCARSSSEDRAQPGSEGSCPTIRNPRSEGFAENDVSRRPDEIRAPRPLRTVQFASPSFDVSFQELFSTWAGGGCLVLASDDARRDPAELLRLLREQRIERLFLPFVALHQLAEAAAGCALAALPLREVITAGEQLRITPAIAALFAQLPACRLYNQYGPTETHLATEFALTGAPASWDALPSIGRPIGNVRVYVLDGERRPTPIGVPGELYIGGAGVASGYIGRPELTAEWFVDDPFGPPGGRMYRTGDRAKYLASGDLVFLGRADDQVKIRGYRIEPGEIEAALSSHPAVSEAAVVVRTEGGAARLIGYVVGDASSADLKAYLRARLPDYMVPAAIVQLPALPLSPNGKVDRKALPRPDVERAEVIAPRTAMEAAIAKVWEAVLGVAGLGATDNFFEAGGHSLLATQVISRLRAALGVELPVRALFEAPTIGELASRLEAATRTELAVIAPVGRAQPLPLSFAQHRLWFIEQLEPGFAYNVPLSVRLRGRLAAGALEAALGQLVQRHEILRTRFAEVDGEPRQVIAAELAVPLAVEPVTEDAIAERARREAQLPFDLAAGPLIRARLLRLADDDHVLLLVLHHIVCDGWSMAILLRELGEAQRAMSGERTLRLPLAIQYADYAAWQRQWLTGARLGEQLAYWTRQLAGAPAMLELPTDRPRPAVRTVRGAEVRRALASELTGAVRVVSQREAATEFMTLLAAFAALLARYSGQRDIVVGSPIAGRSRPELEPLIGLFVNTLALRVDTDGAPSFRALIARVREVCLGAYAHQDLPFEKLVDALKPEREPSRTPVFQVAFALQSAPTAELGVPGLATSPVDVHPGMAKFDLTLFVHPLPDGLMTTWEYNTDLFDRTTVERMAAHYVSLLARLVANPELQPATLPLVSAAEREQLLALGEVRAPYPHDASLQALFEAQVARTPAATAVVFGGTSLSYAALNARANRLARYLAARGVGRGDRAGICLGRSIDFIVSVVATIKAGACYVPLDPSYPVERLAYMAADAGVRVVILRRTGDASAIDLTGMTGAPIWLDDAEAELARLPEGNPPVVATSRDLGYVMYTSGSTGQPKGTCIEQRSIARLVLGTDYVQLDSSDVVAHLSNTSFDAATFEIWGALLTGAQLRGIAHDVVMSVDAFARELASGITAMFITTPLFHQLAAVAPHAFAAIEHLLVGGEVLDTAAVRRVLVAGPPRRLANVYGPTETTTFATWHLIGDVDDGVATIPIGRPIANTTVRILDEQRNLVPVGVRGELYIGGPGVARGYWNRPALTAERFIDDPFSSGPELLYRTGDIGAWRSDGAIEFHGRVDHQVKLRGFRIELGEIEVQLLGCDGVAAASAIIRDDTGDSRLVAYVVPRAGEMIDVDAVRARLAAVLPRYMLPSAIVALDRLPTMPNGKLDRRALPAPSGLRVDRGGGYVAPEGELAQAIARIWAEVLGVDRVGADDNFFDLGGSSFLLVPVRARIEVLLGRPVPMVVLAESLTVAQLASRLAARNADLAASCLVRLSAGRTNAAPVFFVHGSGGQALIYRELVRAIDPDRAMYGLAASGLDAGEPLHVSVEDMANHYLALVRGVQPAGPYLLVGASFGGMVVYEMARRLTASGLAVAMCALLDTPGPGLIPEADADDAEIIVSHLEARSWLSSHQLRGRSLDDQLAIANDAARAAGVALPFADLAQGRRLVEVWLNNLRALARYTAPPWAGEIAFFAAEQHSPRMPANLERGWIGRCTVHAETAAGDHWTMLQPPHVAALGARIRSYLERTRSQP